MREMGHLIRYEICEFAEAMAETLIHLGPDADPSWQMMAERCGLRNALWIARLAVAKYLGPDATALERHQDPLAVNDLADRYIASLDRLCRQAEAMDDVYIGLLEQGVNLVPQVVAFGDRADLIRELVAQKLWLIRRNYPGIADMDGIELELIYAFCSIADAVYWRQKAHIDLAMSFATMAMTAAQNALLSAETILARSEAPRKAGQNRWAAQEPLKQWLIAEFVQRHARRPYKTYAGIVRDLAGPTVEQARILRLQAGQFSPDNVENFITRAVKEYGFQPAQKKPAVTTR